MITTLTGISGKQYEFETSGFSASREPKFATPGVYIFAQQTGEEIKPMFIDHAMNIHAEMNDPKKFGLAVERQCNIILWRQVPFRMMQDVARDLLDKYHPPINDEPPIL